MTSADQITRDPQNPYKSFLVNASAGTGKTYQLSHRFLHLIAAHADPSKVLAVTFTVKAGQEMQERILGEAQNLLHSPEDREAFDLKAKEFWNALPAGHTVTEPLTASAAALLILQHSSNLQIQTLDSLMSQWLRTFGRLSQIETGDIGSEDQLYALYKEAFQEMLENLNQQKLLQVAATTFPDKGVQEILPRLEALHATKLGPLAVVKDAKNEKPFPPFEIQVIKDGYGKYLTPTGIKVFDELPDKLEGKSQATALLTLKKTLKTQLFKSRGAALDRDQPLFRDELEKWCQQTLALEQKKSLAAKHKLLSAIHTMFQGKLQDKKNAKGLWDFVDIETETARLISNPELSGIHYFLMGQVQHLLVDEFQDTSSSQWQVLKPLAEELLSGQGTTEGFPPTVFLVGDPKRTTRADDR